MSTELKSLIGRLNPTCRRLLETAAELCVKRTNYDVEVEHLLYRMLETDAGDVSVVMRHFDRDPARTLAELTQALDGMKRGNARTPAFSPHLPRLLERAWIVSSLQLGEDAVRSGALLLAVLEDESLRGVILESAPSLLQIPRQALRDNLAELVGASPEQAGGGNGSRPPGVGAEPASPGSSGRTGSTALDQFTIDLTEQARAGKIDPVRGRDDEIRQLIDILMRRRQNNPLLAGEAGVGKTAVVEGLALRINAGEVPAALRNTRLRTLDLGLLQAGAGVKGEFEHRLKTVIDEVKSSIQPTILFVDEAHTLIGAGGAEGQGDAANLLKPALARGELRTIAATTWSEYKKYFEKDAALARRFQVIKIEEPDEARATEMLRVVSEYLQEHHKVRILDEAVHEAVRLSHRYIPGRQLPDKAVSVLDTAAARVAVSQDGLPPTVEAGRRRIEQLELELEVLQREQASGGDHAARLDDLRSAIETARHDQVEIEDRWRKEISLAQEIDRLRGSIEGLDEGSERQQIVTQMSFVQSELHTLQGDDPLVHMCVDGHAIATVISGWTGIPVGKMLKDEIRAVLGLRARLADRIIGQPAALDSLVRRIQTYRANLEDPDKPVGVFFLVGPSGVGKTETAITLAENLYGGERNMVVVNMSEYQEAHSISSLRGAPPGYVGYGRGGVLTESVRRRPYSVVLLDEVEKAHSDVMELFFQVFDKGKLEDGEGQLVDFKNTLILLTSNVGSDRIVEAVRDARTPSQEELVEAMRPELLRHFSPAFLGRLVIVPYLPLRDTEIAEVVGLKLAHVQQRFWQQHEADLTYADDVVNAIAQRCTEVDSGARNIDYIISQALLPGLSTEILERMARGDRFDAVHIETSDERGFVYRFADETVAA
ncbi:MAG: type VI secretion system ATPase TssH, partial [Gemmatimonadota bacterium]